MIHKLLVSIIIDNFNYGRYLAQAVDSALRQTYDETEVIVVDDGSTDNSREVIANYGDRITPLLKTNEGQASALNVGFAHSTGDIVIFLDADDRLLPKTVEHVVAAFRRHGAIARVQYRLEVIDEAGGPIGWMLPPSYVGMANADLRGDVRRMSNYAWPPTSGVAFSASTLRRMLPMPEQEFRICADYYLMRANALLGRIVSLDHVGAQYRVHAGNAYQSAGLDIDQLRNYMGLVRRSQGHIKRLAEQLGYTDYPSDPAELLDAFVLAHRLVLLRLDPQTASMGEDGRWSLARRGAAAALRRPDAPAVKAMSAVWFAAMAIAPKPLAGYLAEVFLSPGARRWLEALRPPRAEPRSAGQSANNKRVVRSGAD